MDLIKLLDVSNPKKIKDTINLLIENYEGFGDDIRAIADKAAEDSAVALLAGNEAKQIAQNSATTLLQSITQQNNIISQNFDAQDEEIAQNKAEQDATIEAAFKVQDAKLNAQDEEIAQNTTTSDQAKQIAEEALAMIEQADARSQAATETAEDALDLANESIETSELAMNVATDAKSTVDQAISTGVFGTFVHNTAGVSLLHAYMTDNLNQENTDENFYMATPKLVRDALTDYYTKDEAAAKTDIPTEYLVKAVDGFYTLDSYADHTGIYMEHQDGAKKGIYFKNADFACITSGPYPNSYRIFSLRNVVRTTDTDQEIAGIKNYTGGLQKNSVDVATVNDIPTTLSELTEDTAHRLVTDTEKAAWNAKSDFNGSYNNLTDKPTIPTTLSDLNEDSSHRTVTDAEKTTWNAKSDFSGSYNDLTDKPTIPTINVNGTPQSTINFDSDPQTQINNLNATVTNNYNTLNSSINTTKSDLSSEITTRQNVDNALQNADTNLQNQINSINYWIKIDNPGITVDTSLVTIEEVYIHINSDNSLDFNLEISASGMGDGGDGLGGKPIFTLPQSITYNATQYNLSDKVYQVTENSLSNDYQESIFNYNGIELYHLYSKQVFTKTRASTPSVEYYFPKNITIRSLTSYIYRG